VRFAPTELGGRGVIVKNTFLDVARSPSPLANRRSKSVPSLARYLSVEDFLNEGEEEQFESRGRSRTCAVDELVSEKLDKFEMVEVMSNSSTCVPESTAVSSSSSSGEAASPVEEIRVSLEARNSFVLSSCMRWRAGSWADAEDSEEELPACDATTMMFRNLPETFTRPELEALLDAEGFAGLYDFIYLPANLSSGACFGYAFVNLVSTQVAAKFMRHFQGFTRWSTHCDKRAQVHPSEGIQGRQEQCERYRNSAFMHESVSDLFKPAIYEQGVRVPFLAPTMALKAPRVKGQRTQQPPTVAQQQPQTKVIQQEAKCQKSQPAGAGRARATWMSNIRHKLSRA